jgi:hypothetical protein
MFGRSKSNDVPPTRLMELLQDYPPFTPHHLGRNGAGGKDEQPLLTLEQCRENLWQYVEAIPARLNLLRSVLSGLDIDLDSAFDAPVEYVTKLHTALIVELPTLYRRELFLYNQYELSDRAGADIGLSFMSDLGMLEVAVMLKAKPGCFIGLNLDNKDRTMASYRRPCLLGLTDKLFPGSPPDIFDLDELYFSYFSAAGRGGLASPEAIAPEIYEVVIGGWMLIRLDRYIVAPDLKERLETTWMRKAV